MSLNQMELQNLRHLIGAHKNSEKKLNFMLNNARIRNASRCFSRQPNPAARPFRNCRHF